MVQAQLRLRVKHQARGQGKNYTERLFNSVSNDNYAPFDICLKRLLPLSLLMGSLGLLFF